MRWCPVRGRLQCQRPQSGGGVVWASFSAPLHRWLFCLWRASRALANFTRAVTIPNSSPVFMDAAMPEDGISVESLNAQLQQLTQGMRLLQQQVQARADPVGTQEDGEDEGEITWGEIISTARVEASQEDSQKFLKLLNSSPNLKDLKEAAQQVRLFSGVPETPPPRKHKVDFQWYTVQHKIEMGLHLMTMFMEGNNRSSLVAAAAWYRSAWQDAQESRRKFLAGNQAWKLPQRPDDKKPRLFTEEEERKFVRPQKKTVEHRPYQWGQSEPERQPRPLQRWGPSDGSRSSSRPRGKGKGKGKPWQK